VPIVYTSTTLALAAFELLVHVGRDDLPDDLVAVKVHVPDDLPRSHLKPSQLPTNWAGYRAPLALAGLGDAWAAAGRTALLVVPSAAIPDSENVLINPLHKRAAGRIRVLSRKPFCWDRRLRPPTR
jgi:RES domain-containing protein